MGKLYQKHIQMLAGTYLGLVEKLDYLQTLGINAIELLPVQEFNELEYYQVSLLLLCSRQRLLPPGPEVCNTLYSLHARHIWVVMMYT